MKSYELQKERGFRRQIDEIDPDTLYVEPRYTDDETVNHIITKSYTNKFSFIWLNHQLYKDYKAIGNLVSSGQRPFEFMIPDMYKLHRTLWEYVKFELLPKDDAVRTKYFNYYNTYEEDARKKCEILIELIQQNLEKYKQLDEQGTNTTEQTSESHNADLLQQAFRAYRSKSKTKSLIPDITDEELDNKEVSMVKNYFPTKANKKYMLHHLAPPGTFQMDLLISGVYYYLLAINVTTRKAFAVCTNETNFDAKSVRALKIALMEIMNQTTVKCICMDGEASMFSDEMVYFLTGKMNKSRKKSYYNDLDKLDTPITLINCTEQRTPGSTNHTKLALIDRLCRTIRDIFNNITGEEYYRHTTGRSAVRGNVITPSLMYNIIDIYNSAPHETLNKIIRYRVVIDEGPNKGKWLLSPDLVDSIPELQNIYYKNLMGMNYLQTTQDGYQLPVGTLVSILNERDKYMDKRRTIVRPRVYRIIGMHGGYYICQNVEESHDKVEVPRFKVSPIVGSLIPRT